jgi:hypothetical protein
MNYYCCAALHHIITVFLKRNPNLKILCSCQYRRRGEREREEGDQFKSSKSEYLAGIEEEEVVDWG